MLKKVATLILANLLGINLAVAQVIIGEQDPWPPFIGTDGNSGVAFEMVKAAYKTQGIEFKMRLTPWARALDNVKNGETDVLVATWFFKERTDVLNYSEEFLRNNIHFIKKAEDPFEYTDLNSLTGKKIGIIRDYGYYTPFLEGKNYEIFETRDLITNLLKLKGGRVDLTLEDPYVATTIMKSSNEVSVSDFAFTKGILTVKTLHVAAGKKHPKNKEIIDAFNAGLKVIKENGTYDKIFSQLGEMKF